MAAQREAIFAALFARLATLAQGGSPLFVQATRINKGWGETPPAEMPALFLGKGPEKPTQVRRGLPSIWEYAAVAEIWCSNAGDPSAPPSTQLNNVIDAVDQALQRQPNEVPAAGHQFETNSTGGFHTTLGGLVSSCYIREGIEVFEGLAESGGIAVALIPITLITTS